MSETETPRKRNSKIFLYVPHAWLDKAIEVGWTNPCDLGPPHNNYSILMEWTHDCEPVMPFRSREKRGGR